jgi:hypothetical protein
MAKKSRIDFVDVNLDGSPIESFPRILICANAGDLIVWDSRTVHCNTPALDSAGAGPALVTSGAATVDVNDIEIAPPPVEAARVPTDPQLLRLVSYVCMVPRRFASSEVLRVRKAAFRRKVPTSHWPHAKIIVYENEPVVVDETGCPEVMLRLVGYSDFDIFLLKVRKAFSFH